MEALIIGEADYAQLRRRLCGAAAVVIGLGLLVFAAKHLLGHGNLLGLGPLLSLRDEHNLPTYFSSLLLLSAAGVSWLTATEASRSTPRDRQPWRWLAVGFLVLSVDESVGLHEALGNSDAVAAGIDGLFEGGRPGFLYFGWTVLALPLLVLLLVVYLPFLMRQAPAFRARLLACGAIYVGAAVGLQFIEGWLRSLGTSAYSVGLAYDLATVIEETLEISAVVAYVLALLQRLVGPQRKLAMVLH